MDRGRLVWLGERNWQASQYLDRGWLAGCSSDAQTTGNRLAKLDVVVFVVGGCHRLSSCADCLLSRTTIDFVPTTTSDNIMLEQAGPNGLDWRASLRANASSAVDVNIQLDAYARLQVDGRDNLATLAQSG